MRIGPATYPTLKIARFIEWIELCQTSQFSALELEFVRITSSEYPTSETMKQLAEHAEKKDIKLSIHGSFYINLAAIEENKIELSKEHIKQGIRVAQASSANLIFHPGYFQKLTHGNAIQKSIKLLNSLDLSDPSLIFLETPGKLNSIGSLSEMLEIAAQTGVQIGIDFGHYYARTVGKGIKEKKDILKILSTVENAINQKYFHMHISGIEYTNKGERRHLSFADSDFPLEIVIQALQEVDFSGTLICESPKRWEGDTELLLQLIRGEKIIIPRKKRITLYDYFE